MNTIISINQKDPKTDRFYQNPKENVRNDAGEAMEMHEQKLSSQLENKNTFSNEFVATLIGRFREVHNRLALNVEIYSSEVEAIVGKVEAAFGYPSDSSYRKWFETHRDIGAFLCDTRGTFEPFVERIREDMTFGVRRQIERLFLHLAGKHEVNLWFEDLLSEEGFYPDEAND